MLSKLHRKEEGFTLIELMVVVLIIAILIAIAIPTFIGMRDRGYDSQAKSNLRNGITAAKTYYTDQESYNGIGATSLSNIESAVTFADDATKGCDDPTATDGVDADHAIVYVDDTNSGGENICMATWTKGSDKWYYFSADGSTETLVVR